MIMIDPSYIPFKVFYDYEAEDGESGTAFTLALIPRENTIDLDGIRESLLNRWKSVTMIGAKEISWDDLEGMIAAKAKETPDEQV